MLQQGFLYKFRGIEWRQFHAKRWLPRGLKLLLKFVCGGHCLWELLFNLLPRNILTFLETRHKAFHGILLDTFHLFIPQKRAKHQTNKIIAKQKKKKTTVDCISVASLSSELQIRWGFEDCSSVFHISQSVKTDIMAP